MPNIRSQTINRQGITIVASDGRTFSLSTAQIQVMQAAAKGTVDQKRAAVLAGVVTQMAARLGSNMGIGLTFDFDPATGEPTLLEVS